VNGVHEVSPQAPVVYNQGASSESNATSEMTDFLTRKIHFNIFAGCGSAVTLGGIAAIDAAGLGGAVNKVPQHVYMMSLDATPPELQFLWSSTSSEMAAILNPPKNSAAVAVQLIENEVTGHVAYNASAESAVQFTTITPNCAVFRPFMIAQFAGVADFTIPKCTFTYTGG
jgi:ABC-type sugar transport system substrate-binding protein